MKTDHTLKTAAVQALAYPKTPQTQPTGPDLPRWAYLLLALVAAAIGIAASTATAQMFILGMQRMEPEAAARDVLMATGVLMIVTEVTAFFVAALLPPDRLRSLRVKLLVLGILLVGFECATLYLTQTTLAHSIQAQSTGQQTRIDQLQAQITAQRHSAAALRANGEAQTASKFAWNRADGGTAIRDAAAIDGQTAPLVLELARLQASQHQGMESALGSTGTQAYHMARAVLVSGMGLVMCGAAGALLRSGKSTVASVATASSATETVAEMTRMPTVTVAPDTGKWRSRAAVPLVGLAMATVAPTVIAAPAVAVPAAPKAPTATVAQDAPPPPPAKDPQDSNDRYTQARAAVIDGGIKPSVRALQAAIGGSTLSVRAMQQRLLEEGVIERHGQGYRLAGMSAQTSLL